MKAVSVAVLLTLSAVCFYQVDAKCDNEVVKKIKELNLDNSNILERIEGEYIMAFFEAGPMTIPFQNQCLKIMFHQDDDVFFIDYDKIRTGSYQLVMKSTDSFMHLGLSEEPDMTYYPVVVAPDVVAFYLCTEEDGDNEPVLSYVGVSTKVNQGRKELVESAKEKLKSVGIEGGRDLEACFKPKVEEEEKKKSA